MAVIPKMVGARIKRREDPRLITGRATYVDDLRLPNMLYVSLVRSMYANAKIGGIDAGAAKGISGVVAVFTAEDLKDRTGPVPCVAEVPGMKLPHHPILAEGKVRYVGEPIAAVVATSRYVARDGADAIDVDYDPLDAVVDPEKAAEPGGPLVHEEFGDNVAFHTEAPSPEADRAFREADEVVKLRIVQQRLIPMAMEPRATVAQWDAVTHQLTVWSTTQIPHLYRTQLAEALRMPEPKPRA